MVDVKAAMAAAKTGEPLPPNPHRTVTSFMAKSTAARNGKISSVLFHERSAPSQEMIASPPTMRTTPARTKGPGRSPSTSIASAVENIGVVLTMVDVIALPMFQSRETSRPGSFPDTKSPTATKVRLSTTKIGASG